MSRRVKVPNVMRTNQQVTNTMIKSDKMGDVKKFYGWTERHLEQQVRNTVGSQADRSEILKTYKEAYGRKI